MNLGRLDDARAVLQQAEANKLDGLVIRSNFYGLAFLRGDAAEMERQVSLGCRPARGGRPDALYPVRHRSVLRTTGPGARLFPPCGGRCGAWLIPRRPGAIWQANAALREAEFGNAATAKQQVDAALALAPGRDVKVLAAMTLARAGDTARATKIVEQLEKSEATNTMLKLYWLPTIHAAIELSGGKPSQAR